MLIKSNKDKLDVEITIKNQKDNAYNTKVILNFSPNINYVTAKVSCVKLLSVTQPFSGSILVLKPNGWFGIVPGGLHSEPHQGRMYRRIPLPRQQQGGPLHLVSQDQCNDTPSGFDFPSSDHITIPLCSSLQKHFRVTFEANPNHIQEFIQINIKATR